MTNIAVVALATARLTRFLTSDLLGEWWVAKPARDWGAKHERRAIYQERQRLRLGSIDLGKKLTEAGLKVIPVPGPPYGEDEKWLSAGDPDVAEWVRREHVARGLVAPPHEPLPDLTDDQLMMEKIPEWWDHEHPLTWQAKVAKGVECPFCAGLWVGVGVLAVTALEPVMPKPVRVLWRLALGGLALNYVTGHVSSRLDGAHE